MLLHRELRPTIVIELLVSAAVSLAAAHQLARATADAAVPGIVLTLLRRFDGTMALALALLLTLRIAVRAGDDRRDGWLEPVIAAGAARWRYGIALPAAALLRAAASFVAAAIAFAIGLRVFASSSELLTVLPRTIGAGLLLLASFAACAAPIAFLVRNVGAAVTATFTIALLPIPLLGPYLFNGTPPPSWLLPIPLMSPLRMPPTDPASAVQGVAYIIVGMALAAAAAHRFAGRRS
jgi:hypothetical protein